MELHTQRLDLRSMSQKDAVLYLEYKMRNENFLKVWEPTHSADSFLLSSVRKAILIENRNRKRKSEFRFAISKRGQKTIIGTVGISSIVYGPFMSCFLGYRLDKDEVNKGYMSEAVAAIVNFAFDELGLHRIEANIMPRNVASRRAVSKVGFVEEGLSRNYLKINGVWEDHAHYVFMSDQVRVKGPLRVTELETCFGIVSRAIEALHASGIDQWDDIYPGRQTVFQDLQAGHVFAAANDEGIMGTVVLNEDQSPEWADAEWRFPKAKALVVHRLVVDPRFQGRGIGKMLMQFTEEFARRGLYESIRLDAFPQNTVSVRMYEKLGYSHAGTARFRKGEMFCFEKAVATPAAKDLPARSGLPI